MGCDFRRSDTMAANIASRGVRAVLRWLRIRVWEFEAVERTEDSWGLYVEDAEPGDNGAWHDKFWCGSWVWNKNCRMGNHCKFMHPSVKFKLCNETVPGNVNGKMIPVRRINLQDACQVAPERIIFVEHNGAGIVWGRIFNADMNTKLITAFLQSPWFFELSPFSRVGPACPEALPARLIPDTCWHQVAAAAGLRTLLKMQVALGRNVEWASWLHQVNPGKQMKIAGPKPAEESAIDHTLEASKNGRVVCVECLHWRGSDLYERCSDCKRFVCQACCAVHICQNSAHSFGAQETCKYGSLPKEPMGCLIRAAAECTAIASALRARHVKPCRSARSSPPHVAGGAQWSGLVEQCMVEPSPLRPSRLLDFRSEVLSACYSSALFAVRTKQQIRVIRRDDWKTLLSVPAASMPSCESGLEVLEGRSLLITTASNGLSIHHLETLESTLVHTQGDDWLLKVVGNGLLTGSAGAACLRDLERPNLPLISTWCCQPLSFGSTGAIVIAPDCRPQFSLSLRWLDPRQPELLAWNLLSEWKGFAKGTASSWTAAAPAPSDDEHLVVLGNSNGQLIATDLRHSRMPLWSIDPLGIGAVRRIRASEHLIFAETNAARDARPNPMTQAVSWNGRSLAVFTGMHVVASPSGAASGPKSKSLLACGIGNSVLLVGAAPSVMKEKNLRSDEVPRNGHKSRVWERGTRHSNNRRT
eukprot:gnl/MRDRNA2_/MRDRNA2_101161_c0_seq1.p1 gnl/MRDRNA2_/MRDRNA2_101161_c0~~gnl/MRDRNA2_/MRDRNA2_101161_c0_seq1.p1  ORF type:complete len:700 (+),score=80.11 gnl/MRDRNA2_/MRDRNA2_101161_c0_seq1:107-2206(+)